MASGNNAFKSRWLQASCIEDPTCIFGTGAMLCRKPGMQTSHWTRPRPKAPRRPKMAQKGPKRPQEGPKRAPKEPNIDPKRTPQEAPETPHNTMAPNIDFDKILTVRFCVQFRDYV